MAGPKTYVGVSGVARQVKNIYVGVSGVARKVKKAYVGVNGVARLVYSSDWWCPTGVSTSSVLAAYRFKGAASESAALTDLSGHGYTLAKGPNSSGTPLWSAANGFYVADSGIWWQRLTNTTLVTQDIQSLVVRYANYPSLIVEEPLCDAGGKDGYAILRLSGGNGYGEPWPGTSAIRTEKPYIVKDNSGNVLQANQKMVLTGTMGMTIKTAIYINGSAMTLTSYAVANYPGKTQYGYLIPIPRAANLAIYAAAYFSVSLTAAQHKEVHDAMMQL